jgi:hypothetical protein
MLTFLFRYRRFIPLFLLYVGICFYLIYLCSDKIIEREAIEAATGDGLDREEIEVAIKEATGDIWL